MCPNRSSRLRSTQPTHYWTPLPTPDESGNYSLECVSPELLQFDEIESAKVLCENFSEQKDEVWRLRVSVIDFTLLIC